MSDITAPPVRQSAIKLTGMYLAFLIGGIVLLWILLWAAEEFFQFVPSSNAMGLILPMVSAMGVGGIWFKKEGGRPASGRAWRMAVIWALATVAIQLLLVAAAWNAGFLGELIGSQGPTDEDFQILAIAFGVIAILQMLMLRVGLWASFRGADKQMQREAEKLTKRF